MFAMLLKDILSLKKNIIGYAAFLVIYTIISVYSGSGGFFLTVLLVFWVMMPVAALSVDEHCHWERMQTCMPVSRGAAVISKYVLALLSLFFALIPAFAAMALRVIPAISAQDIIFMAIFGIFITALQMPFLILLGVEKGRFISMGVILLVCFGVPMLVRRSDFILRGTERFFEHIYNEMTNHIQLGMWLLGLAAVVLMAISVWISIHGYQKKEIT